MDRSCFKRRKRYVESMLSWRNASMKQAGHHGLDRHAASLACRLRELPDASRRERKLARLRAERAQRVRHRIGHHAAGGDDAALAGALRAQWIDRRGVTSHDN